MTMGIVISHRFSTVRMADEMMVLEQGAVVEQGTHQELMAQTPATRACSTCKPRGIGSLGSELMLPKSEGID